MDPISSNIQNQTANPLAQNAAATTAPGIGEEFNSFIQLLTAQIRNQDPLSPLDSTQFVEQLATFSTLEQQVGSNARLDSIADAMNNLHALIATEWIDQPVTVESSWVPFNGDPIEFGFEANADADSAQLNIRDAQGNEIWSEELDPSAFSYMWNGQNADGTIVGNDTLNQISIDLYRAGEYVGSVAPRIVTTVTNIAHEDGKVRVGTALNMSAELDALRKIEN